MVHRHRGFGKVELIVGIACMFIVIVVAVLVLRAGRVDSVWHPKDAWMMKGIHQSMLVFAREFDGLMPRPGLIHREPVDGQHIPGRGNEQVRHNTTAALHSLSVMHNYYTPDMLVSPSEPNPNVKVYDEYNWEMYDPRSEQHWDPTFRADLDRVSHVSYANMYMYGERFDRYWRETLGPAVPVIGNRGPADGARDRNSFTTDGNGNWSGRVVGGDNAVQLLTSMSPRWLTFGEDDPQPDNLFALDDVLAGVDVVLTFTRDNTPAGGQLHHD